MPHGIAKGQSRFDVYRNNITVSLTDALGETFPVIKQLVGDEFFAAMAQTYIREQKPASPVLSEYGETFSNFIKAFGPAQNLTYLSDVARLEWGWLNAYHAADVAPLDINALAEVTEDVLDAVTFSLHPSLSMVCSNNPVVSIWQAHQGTKLPDLSALVNQAECALIIRPVLDVHVIPVDPITCRLIAAVAQGGMLGNVCDALSGDPDFDPSARLAALFSYGAVVALNPRDTTIEGRMSCS